MKKYILLSMLIGMMLLVWVSCEDYNKEYLDEAVTTLYIKNSGEVPLTLYHAGVDDTYKVVVDKTGYNLAAETDAKIILLNQIDLDIYNQEHGTAYKLLPDGCYVLPADLSCSFGSGDLYKTFDLTLKTEDIYNQLIIPSDATYVLPLQLVASNDSINTNKNYLFLVPTVEVPTVYFNKTGFILNSISNADPDHIVLTLPIELIIDNQWSFDCSVSVNEELLEAYNAANSTVFRLLPEEVYTINPTVQFTPGTSLANVQVDIDRTKLGMGTYILPLQLDDCTQEYFSIDGKKNQCLFGISYTPPFEDLTKIPLSIANVTVLSTQGEGGSGDSGGIAALTDGDKSTYYHAKWSSNDYADAVYGDWIDVDFGAGNEKNSVSVGYTTRPSNSNGWPVLIKLYGSTDKTNWTLIGILQKENDGLPQAVGATYEKSPVFSSPDAFRYFRFAVPEVSGGKTTGGKGYLMLAEYNLWAQ
ncbi:MAG: DUF1735 domain-containing protein [Prevotella sp.]|jgi:hypothetical protein|nr:DUF1735 domain-containing protein [Prevotella sp.]